jgi:phospholipid/cholesterol/gamma-HCH transport system substrate-binding protein
VTRRLSPLAVALVGAIVLSSCAFIGGRDTYDVVAYFPRAVSLYESGSVQVLGLPAGEVSEIEVVGDQVKVTMAIHDDVPLPEDVQAAIVPQSLIGERRIQLFPPFQEGDPVVSDGYEIAEEDTIVPVEPDEALAALKEFLDSLDPNGVGRLIDNAATTLDGQGENLGSALEELSELVGNIEQNDDSIITIAERFDDFTSTLLTRETQLAQALDDFAVVADVLADERADIERLIRGLTDLSGDGLDLVSEHAVRLRTDVEIVTRLARSIDTNLAGVQDLLTAGPKIFDGFTDAFNPALNALDLRNSFTPLVSEALKPVFDSVGVPLPCLPVDVACPGGGIGGLGTDDRPVEAELERPTTPVDDILRMLGSPTATEAPPSAPARSRDAGSVWDRFVGTFLGVGS